jgi:hypothetical protein
MRGFQAALAQRAHWHGLARCQVTRGNGAGDGGFQKFTALHDRPFQKRLKSVSG